MRTSHGAVVAVARLEDAGRVHVLTPGSSVPDRRRVCVVLDGELSLTMTAGNGDRARSAIGIAAGRVWDPREEGPLPAGMVTSTGARIVTVTPARFDMLAAANGDIGRLAHLSRLDRRERTHLAHLLRVHFPTLDEDASIAHANTTELRTLVAGEDLCVQGEDADVTFLVLRGRLRALRDDRTETITLGEVGPGALLGESALIEAGVRQATLRAVRNTTVAVMTKAWLRELMLDDVQAATGVIGQVIQRIRKEPPFVTRDHVVSLVPTTADLDVAALAEAVATNVAGDSWSCRVVYPQEADELFGVADIELDGNSPRAVELRAWLDDMDREHDFVILVGRSGLDDWTREIVEQADRLILVADAAGSPRLTPVEMAIATQVASGVHSRRTLLLLHADDVALPSGTSEWLGARDVDDHLHARPTRSADVGRVARILTGEPVAVAVGGGGARATAAVGAVEVLAARGVPVDVVAGTSMGSFVAAGMAMGLDTEALRRLTIDSLDGLKDYTLPIISVIRGKALWDRMQELFGHIDIEDLWLPFGCTSSDLTDGSLVFHLRGSLAEAIRASVSVPGLLPPVDKDGHVLVDGAVIDNLPVSLVTHLAPLARVIAIDVSAPEGPVALEPLPRHVSGFRALLRQVVPGLTPVRTPSPMRVIMQSSAVGAARRRREVLESGRVDCHVRLDIAGYALMDFERVDRIIEIGRRDSVAAIAEWLEQTEASDRPIARDGGTPLVTGPVPARPSGAATVSRSRQAMHRAAGILHLTIQDLRYRARRFVVAIGGTAVVLTLFLLMTGLVAQFDRESLVTVQNIGATHWAVPAGVSGPFTSTVKLPPDTAAQIVPGEDGRADEIVLGRTRYESGSGGGEFIVVGHGDGLGKPPVIAGRTAEMAGELTVSEDADLPLGATVQIAGSDLEVVGLVGETTILAGIPLAFLPTQHLLDVFGLESSPPSAILLDGVPASVPGGIDVVGIDLVAEATRAPLEQAIQTINLVRLLLAIVAAMIISTVTFLATIDRQRDVAVLRAMGTSPGALGASVALQAVMLAMIAAAIAAVLQGFVAPVFPMRVHLTTGDFLLLPVMAAAIAGVAAYGAIRRTLRIDPASAFGGPGA